MRDGHGQLFDAEQVEASRREIAAAATAWRPLACRIANALPTMNHSYWLGINLRREQ